MLGWFFFTIVGLVACALAAKVLYPDTESSRTKQKAEEMGLHVVKRAGEETSAEKEEVAELRKRGWLLLAAIVAVVTVGCLGMFFSAS